MEEDGGLKPFLVPKSIRHALNPLHSLIFSRSSAVIAGRALNHAASPAARSASVPSGLIPFMPLETRQSCLSMAGVK
jgi:hypothetical protein